MIYTLNGCTMYDYHRSGPKRIESDGKILEKFANSFFP